jgi:hypothetical protein
VGLRTKLTGDGFVVSQSPAAGEPVEPGGVSTLQLNRNATDARAGGGPR